ncbi:MAG: hypothetical protein OM95_14190 [Bdellovibrio sp. ArHS]|uniref:cytochrome c oxidase subunit 3 n=1 Tax=Bdellovibrio sp. ArHS TaxID=1569284 RepID=UPI000583431C|nr:cytochrome c oxidase subunit 3 [Bdellovibrio sp. ArHS]KHD87513.1 MAG: hypothetical protein OM95_14190 [Bdellovibrio sp. ArHS]
MKKYNPERLPGSVLMWLIVVNELLVFVGILGAFILYQTRNSEEFIKGQASLSLSHGVISTVSLLVAGFFAAEGIRLLHAQKISIARIHFLLAALLGIYFLFHKWQDFAQKWSLGFDFVANDFWQYYWLTMGFHFVHVLVGVGILFYLLVRSFPSASTSEDLTVKDYESGVLFWHMCDLAWILIFPVFYFGAQQ